MYLEFIQFHCENFMRHRVIDTQLTRVGPVFMKKLHTVKVDMSWYEWSCSLAIDVHWYTFCYLHLLLLCRMQHSSLKHVLPHLQEWLHFQFPCLCWQVLYIDGAPTSPVLLATNCSSWLSSHKLPSSSFPRTLESATHPPHGKGLFFALACNITPCIGQSMIPTYPSHAPHDGYSLLHMHKLLSIHHLILQVLCSKTSFGSLLWN